MILLGQYWTNWDKSERRSVDLIKRLCMKFPEVDKLYAMIKKENILVLRK